MKLVNNLAYVTAEEMREMDEQTIGGYSIDVMSLMENAGLGTAEIAKHMLNGEVRGKRVACLAGKGNNGGDGFVASRHLHDWGADVTLVLAAQRESVVGVPAEQLRPLEKMGLRIAPLGTPLSDFALLIDALLGYGAKGDPREPVASLIRDANGSGVQILALDLPSGLDSMTGEPYEPCIRAKATVTLGLPKVGFLNPRAGMFLGDLYLADISIPPEVYAIRGQAPGLFDKARVVRI